MSNFQRKIKRAIEMKNVIRETAMNIAAVITNDPSIQRVHHPGKYRTMGEWHASQVASGKATMIGRDASNPQAIVKNLEALSRGKAVATTMSNAYTNPDDPRIIKVDKDTVVIKDDAIYIPRGKE